MPDAQKQRAESSLTGSFFFVCLPQASPTPASSRGDSRGLQACLRTYTFFESRSGVASNSIWGLFYPLGYRDGANESMPPTLLATWEPRALDFTISVTVSTSKETRPLYIAKYQITGK
jgi:hypothetical protein